MSVDYTCGSEEAQAALAGFLYGECDRAERTAIEAHLATCVACAGELAALGATRSALASWTPPDVELGFRIVAAATTEASSNVLRPARWWRRPLPAWAQAAAALLIFTAGGLLGMRAGATTGAPAPAAAVAPSVGASTVSAQDLAALEQRLRREMTALRVAEPRAALRASAPPAASSGDERLMQRVRALVAESEQRQERQMATRLSQVLRDVDMQRRLDLARIEDTFGRMEGVTGAELLQQRRVINYLRQVAQRPQ